MTLSHIGTDGSPRMVDVGDKPTTARTAVAEGVITMSREAMELVRSAINPKGDVLSTAQLAGTMAAKRTFDLIPLCHPLTLDHLGVEAVVDEGLPGVRVQVEARAEGKTGVEMEALTGASVALLTVYDMVKSAGHEMEIGPIRLLRKSGGRSGSWSSDTKSA